MLRITGEKIDSANHSANMHHMHVSDLDMTQLRLLEAIAETGSLTAAAGLVSLSQSAASHSLARLRKACGDALFVRAGHRMLPTPYGEQICETARDALRTLRNGFRGPRSFDAATSQRIFTIYMSEAGQLVFLPKLLQLLKKVAPSVRLRVLRVPEENPSHALESGEVDLAIGHITTMTTGFHRRRLVNEQYVCIACRNNSALHDNITLDEYRTAHHAIADKSGMAHWIVDRALEVRGIKRQIGLVVPEFLALPFVIYGSEMIATVPQRVAEQFSQLLPIKIMPMPIKLDSYEVLLLWHERAHRDAANRWLRHSLAALFDSGV